MACSVGYSVVARSARRRLTRERPPGAPVRAAVRCRTPCARSGLAGGRPGPCSYASVSHQRPQVRRNRGTTGGGESCIFMQNRLSPRLHVRAAVIVRPRDPEIDPACDSACVHGRFSGGIRNPVIEPWRHGPRERRAREQTRTTRRATSPNHSPAQRAQAQPEPQAIRRSPRIRANRICRTSRRARPSLTSPAGWRTANNRVSRPHSSQSTTTVSGLGNGGRLPAFGLLSAASVSMMRAARPRQAYHGPRRCNGRRAVNGP